MKKPKKSDKSETTMLPYAPLYSNQFHPKMLELISSGQLTVGYPNATSSTIYVSGTCPRCLHSFSDVISTEITVPNATILALPSSLTFPSSRLATGRLQTIFVTCGCADDHKRPPGVDSGCGLIFEAPVS